MNLTDISDKAIAVARSDIRAYEQTIIDLRVKNERLVNENSHLRVLVYLAFCEWMPVGGTDSTDNEWAKWSSQFPILKEV